MRLHRFFIPPDSIHDNRVYVADHALLKQMRNVLRMGVGDRVVFLDGTGFEYEAAIVTADKQQIVAAVEKKYENQNEPSIRVTLCQSLCKKDKFEWILEKGTEVGIAAFVPVAAARSEKLGFNRVRAEKILREAAEQSERGYIPKLADMQKFEEALRQAQGKEKIILDKSGESIKTYNLKPNTRNLVIFVGPEGGWTGEELEEAQLAGARIVSIGPRVLRTETAGMIAAAILLNK